MSKMDAQVKKVRCYICHSLVSLTLVSLKEGGRGKKLEKSLVFYQTGDWYMTDIWLIEVWYMTDIGLMLILWPLAVTHFGAYHRPPGGNFWSCKENDCQNICFNVLSQYHWIRHKYVFCTNCHNSFPGTMSLFHKFSRSAHISKITLWRS